MGQGADPIDEREEDAVSLAGLRYHRAVVRRTLCLAVTLSACAYPRYYPPEAYAPPRSAIAPAPPVDPPPEVNIPKILEAVIRVRGLKPLREVPIRTLNDADFDYAFRQANGLGPNDKPKGATTDSRFFDGFYEYTTRSICVREHPVYKQGDSRVVIAHELVHALQHQHFDTDKLKEAASRSRDEQLALKALLEGDAQLTAIGAVSAIDGVPPARAMIMTSALRASDDAAVVVGDDLAALSYEERTRLVFPYEEGERFVGTVFRAGGFPLVNRLYVTPPKTTSFIAHPDAYLAGVPIRPIPPLLFPKETKIDRVQGTRMGEVGLRSMLVSMGSQPAGAEKLAASWRGDWLGVGTKPDGHEAAVGAVVFSNEEDAEVARQIFRGARRGNLVSFADGLTQAQANAVERDALDTPVPDPPASPPFGAIDVPPPPVPLEKQARFGGSFDGHVFTDAGLGLSLPIVNAYQVTINGDALLRAADGHSSMGLVLLDFGQSPWARAQTKAGVLAGARKLGIIVSFTDATIGSPFGPAVERTVQLADGRTFAVVILPICNQRATIMIARLGFGADVFANRNSVQLLDWLNAIDARAVESSEFCGAVEQEWTTELQQVW